MAANLDARILLVVLAIGFLLAGCGSSDPQLGSSGRHRFKPGQPNYTVAAYQINGVWYHPKADYSYDETGTASWYGPGLYGAHLACGGTLTPGTLGVANKTLPCGTHVTFRYGGRTVNAVVDDRGPYVGGRDWDLNQNSAAALGFNGVDTVWSTR